VSARSMAVRAVVLVALLALAGCAAAPAVAPRQAAPSVEAMATPAPTPVPGTALPGMPTVTDPHNVYAAAGTGMLSEAARAAKPSAEGTPGHPYRTPAPARHRLATC
jgi:ABC-type transport system substrate-binding protein